MCNQSPIMKTTVQSKVFEDIALKVYNSKVKKKNNFFSQIKLKKISRDSNNNAIACLDQYVGIIKISKKGTYWESFRYPGKDYKEQSDDICNKCNKVLAIVLESPHKYEFDKDKAIGPAMGNTGANLLGWLPQLLHVNNDIDKDTYKVVLVNAVQYQCSLGTYTKRYREDIFSEMWEKAIVSQDFIKRLQSHHPSVVINACTSNGSKIRKENVQVAINSCKININLQSSHPSSWDDKENRRITKV